VPLPLAALVALAGIPAAGCAVILFAVEIPRFAYGQANLFMFAAEVMGLGVTVVLVAMLREWLKSPAAPTSGFLRNVLDFLAIRDWHPAVKFTLIGLLLFPQWWYLHKDFVWLGQIIAFRGWHFLQSVDMQAHLDGIAVVFQLTMTGGVPLLFALHMFTRRKKGSSIWAWLLVPVVFVFAAISVVLLVTIMHR
jgi:hypothetical protein